MGSVAGARLLSRFPTSVVCRSSRLEEVVLSLVITHRETIVFVSPEDIEKTTPKTEASAFLKLVGRVVRPLFGSVPGIYFHGDHHGQHAPITRAVTQYRAAVLRCPVEKNWKMWPINPNDE